MQPVFKRKIESEREREEGGRYGKEDMERKKDLRFPSRLFSRKSNGDENRQTKDTILLKIADESRRQPLPLFLAFFLSFSPFLCLSLSFSVFLSLFLFVSLSLSVSFSFLPIEGCPVSVSGEIWKSNFPRDKASADRSGR